MATMNGYWQEPVLPWSESENDQRFKTILKALLLAFIVLGIVIPYITVPKPEIKRLEQVAPRLAKLLIEKQQQKPKPPKIKPRTSKKKVASKKKLKKEQAARKKAQQSGLLAMQNELSTLKDAFDISSLTDTAPLAKGGKNKTKNKPSSLMQRASQDSGGIDTRTLSKATGNAQLASRTASSIKSTVGGSTFGQQRANSGGKPIRVQEELNFVFEKNKSVIFNIYNRALRKDPTLQGKVVLELTIAPNGKVTHCRILSSELNNPALERKLVSRIKLFSFTAKEVQTMTVTWPIDFLPS